MEFPYIPETTPKWNVSTLPSYNPKSNQDLWYIIFLVTAILGFFGNLAITWIVWAHRSMKTITNIYIGNMGIGGLLMTLYAVSFVFPYQTHGTYWNAYGVCKIQEFATSTGLCVFVFSLMMMSVERYHAIVSPDEDADINRFRPSLYKIWLCGFLFTIPKWLFMDTDDSESAKVCFKYWPDYIGGGLSYRLFSFCFVLGTYFVPVAVMVYRNTQLVTKLWGQKLPELTAADKETQKQTVLMMIVQMIVFAILWFPYHMCSIVLGENLFSEMVRYDDLFKTFYLMALSSVVFYPIIYVCMEDRFQKKLKKVFRWCPCIDYESKSVRYVVGNAEQSCNITERYRALADV